MNILTFDIEEWFHIGFFSDNSSWDNYQVRIDKGIDRILDTLDIQNQTATFFCLGWIASKYPEVIRKIHSKGHQIGCHSNTHELVFRLNKTRFKSDTEKAIKSIEDITGKGVNSYRAPGFSITENNLWAFEVLVESKIEYDCSIFPSRHEYGGFPSFKDCHPVILDIHGYKMKEFPMNTVKFLNRQIVFSGGGYFRLFPYTIIKFWMQQSDYVMTYFHPRDFDANQPVLPNLPLLRKFKSYVGLKSAFNKFNRMLEDFEFLNIEEADKEINWNKANTIKIFKD